MFGLRSFDEHRNLQCSQYEKKVVPHSVEALVVVGTADAQMDDSLSSETGLPNRLAIVAAQVADSSG